MAAGFEQVCNVSEGGDRRVSALAIAYAKAAMADSNAVLDALIDELVRLGDRGAVNLPMTSWLS